MNRRMFLKGLAAATGASIIPQSLTSMYRQARADVNYKAIDIDALSVPPIMPQVINLFLYGGPSELAGNLTNIADIEANSESSYLDAFPGLTRPQGDLLGGSITPSGFWGANSVEGDDGAGGDHMQYLVDNGYMSVYRTMMKRKNTSQSHRENILMSQKGSLDINFSAGFGFKLAALISEHRDLFQANSKLADGTQIPDVEQLIMPFISISDGDTRIFDKDGTANVPLLFNGISVDTNLSNPFERSQPHGSADALETLAEQTESTYTQDYSEVIEAFQQRKDLEMSMQAFDDAFSSSNYPIGGTITYPDTEIGRSLRAAVTLAVENPSTLFITLGGELGRWDDHNNGLDSYPDRMLGVFEALRAAMDHIDYAHNSPTPIANLVRPTSNIIINVFGDFGRRVNLNNSLGWNHGNNQNFYTLGGKMPGIRTPSGSDALGNVVGTTVRVGKKNDDGQYTQPAEGSYEFEPMSVASTIFKYFGVKYSTPIDENNPDPLTSFEDPANPGQYLDPGSPPIDEDPTSNGAA